jgi:hypothetical protein
MKHKIRFLLKNPNAKKISAILMIVSWGYRDKSGKYKNLKYATGQSVNPDKWDKKIYQAKGKYSSSVNNELDNIKYKVNKIFNKLEGEVITPDVLKTELDILMDRVKVVSKPKHKKNDY